MSKRDSFKVKGMVLNSILVINENLKRLEDFKEIEEKLNKLVEQIDFVSEEQYKKILKIAAQSIKVKKLFAEIDSEQDLLKLMLEDTLI